MRKVALIYNPASGQHRAGRAERIEAAVRVLQDARVETAAIPTAGPGTAGEQAREAVQAGCETVLACGGDGTAHEVLQGLVGSPAAMGVIPLGTANALAIDLGLPRNAAGAARALLHAQPQRIAVGRMEYCRGGEPVSRYFTVAAGMGPDAHLFYSLNGAAKRRFGNSTYYAQALCIWATQSYPLFEVTYQPTSGGPVCRQFVSQLLAVRITNFGGMLRRLAPGAALHRNDLRLVLFTTQSRARYLQYVTAVLFGRVPRVRGIELADAVSAECRPLPQGPGTPPIRVEADGELLGVLPVKLTTVTDAVSLLVPGRSKGFFSP